MSTTPTTAPPVTPMMAPTGNQATPNLEWLEGVDSPSPLRQEADEEPDDATEGDDEPDEIQVTIVTTEEYTVVATTPEVAIAKIFAPSGEGLDDENGVTLIGRCVQADGHDHPTYEDNTEEA